MRNCLFSLLFISCGLALAEPPPAPNPAAKSLFNGTSLDGWEGDAKYWKVEDGKIVGGSTTETLKHNYFVATTKDYGNFIVRMKLKLTGTGFVNSGIQMRSLRVENSTEMRGYQCDYGDPTWWGCIYDESRRNKVMAHSDMKKLDPVIKRNDWNEYIIKADGPRIQTWINGVEGVDYVEADESIVQEGKIGIQIHSGGKAIIEAKDVVIEELPASPKKAAFVEPESPKMRNINAGPLTGEEQQKTFTLPPGFSIELVAAEEPGIGKFVTVAWDHHGRLWSMSALEYPVDANENKAAAEALYASRAKDKVVYYDFASRGGSDFPKYDRKAKVFADGLAIPLGMLPYKDGAIIQHGQEIVFLRDTDKDGKADKREVLLEGVGIDDSHLFLHGFTRGPGNWIYTAQGAFNHSQIKARDGSVTKWSFCKMGRFTPDGQKFELVAAGLNNIWGFVIDLQGLMWGQEANDLGYPLTEFAVGDNFPGIGNEKLKPYAPVRPKAVSDWQVGGTGLSGLALQEDAVWPQPYGPEKGASETQRTFYLANPITNRIQATEAMPDGKGHFRFKQVKDFVRCSDPWFRPVNINFGPDGCLYIVDWYNKIISHNEVPRNHPERDKERGRIWRVRHESQKTAQVRDIALLKDLNVPATSQWESKTIWAEKVDRGVTDPNGPEWPRKDFRWDLQNKKLDEIASLVKPADGSYDTDFKNYMIRAELESRSAEVAKFLDSEAAKANPEFVLLASQSLEGRLAAKRIAQMLPNLKRPVNDEELLRLTEFSDEPEVKTALLAALQTPATLEGLLRIKNRLDAAKVAPLLQESSKSLLKANLPLALKLIAGFKLAALEPDLAALADGSNPSGEILSALRLLGSTRSDLFLKLTKHSDAAVRDEALLCLAATPDKILPMWSTLNAQQRKAVLATITGTKTGAGAFVAAVTAGTVSKEDLDGPTVEKLQAVLGESDPALKGMLDQMADLFRPVLVLNGANSAFVDSSITLEGPFTVETWIRLEDNIGNADGILGAPGVIDFNFYDARLRVWINGLNDVIVAKKPMAPDMWTHVCVTRDEAGNFKIYLNGELDQADGKPDKQKYENLAIGRTNVAQGTSGALTEYRIWNRARSPQEIRTYFDRSIEKADGLIHRYHGANWPKLSAPARISKTTDFPTLLTDKDAAALDEKFAKFAALAKQPGDPAIGKNLAATCTACHQIGDQGVKIGPPLTGVGAMGIDAILRNILTPNAAMEAGYRVYQIQLTDGTVKEGFLAQDDEKAIILRLPGIPDERIEKSKIRQAKFLKRSLMPEGLIDNFPPEMIRHLLTYLQGLK